MEFKKVIKREYLVCDKFVAKSCIFIAVFTILVWVLNMLNIFIVESYAMTLCAVITIVLMSLPFCIYLLRKEGYLSSFNYKYFSMIIVLMVVGVLYSFLTFHVTLVFLFPAIVFNIYGDKKLLKCTMIGTLLIMGISHITSLYIGVNPEEPFTNIYSVLIYGLFPKFIIYISFMYNFIFETNHNNKMLQKVFAYSRDIHNTQEELIRAFAEMCESKSGQTGHHIKRVSEYVNIIANALNIDDEEKECLITASMM